MEEVGAEAAVELQGLPPEVPDQLLLLYFENRRRSGGGPVLSWRRLGRGGILTFQELADAERVLAQTEHELLGAQLSLRPAPPRAPARLLLQGLPLDTAPLRVEQHVQALLRAVGHPVQPCRALASPRPDRALVQLPRPLSEAEVAVLEQQAQHLDLDGASVSLVPVPQARAVRVVGDTPPEDQLLLQLYLENERHSGGGPVEGLRRLPGPLGTVLSFQQWQVAERVLQRDHWLQGSKLDLVPHYDVLEPEQLAEDASAGDRPSVPGPGATAPAPLEAGELARDLKGAEPAAAGSGRAPGQSEASLRAGSVGSLGPENPVETSVGLPGQEGVVETVLPAEPGAMRFLQLYHEELLASLGDVALFPLEETDVTGFRVSGPVRIPHLGALVRLGLCTLPCTLPLPGAPAAVWSAGPMPGSR